MTETRTLYDSFNARYLDYEEIANLFIINKQYADLIKNNHSLLMGPRGSGKTTLLKMLTIPAQHHWSKKQTGQLEQPPFYAIYIPTDVQWKKQLDDFEDEFKHKPKYKDTIARLIVTTNILISLTETFSNLIEFKEKQETDLKREAELSLQLIQDWKLSKPISTNLAAVQHSLFNRLNEINSHIKKVRILNIPESSIEYPEYFFDDYLGLIVSGCNSFEIAFRDDDFFKNKTFRWAFCFDELEIAPTWLQEELLSLLRSLSYQNILFKLTMVPLVLIEEGKSFSQINAREDQDFEVIRTWAYSKDSIRDWEDFSRRLVQDKFRRRYSDRLNPLSLFGSDDLDHNIKLTFAGEENFKGIRGYTLGSNIWYLFKELASFDKSFRDFLQFDKKISPSNPIPVYEGQKDEVFRKIKPLVLHRFQFRNQSISGRKRSRKNPSLYYGLPFIYHFCDGNPRSLIGVVDEFIRITSFENGNFKRFHISVQSRLIYNISRKYLESISTHPDSNVAYLNKYMNLGTLLKKIGEYFRNMMIQEDFKMDPKNCFTIDKEVPEQILELIKVAMHLGAIIYLDPSESMTKNGLIGKRFRLSFFLFPHFQLPIVEYNDVALSKILRKGTDKIDQLLLFDAK